MEDEAKKLVFWGKVAIGIFMSGMAALAWFMSPIYEIKKDLAVYKTEIENNKSQIVEIKDDHKSLTARFNEYISNK